MWLCGIIIVLPQAEDLGLLMGKLEHWAHRLYPRHPFDDFVERLEKLGSKKPVQVRDFTQNCANEIACWGFIFW